MLLLLHHSIHLQRTLVFVCKHHLMIEIFFSSFNRSTLYEQFTRFKYSIVLGNLYEFSKKIAKKWDNTSFSLEILFESWKSYIDVNTKVHAISCFTPMNNSINFKFTCMKPADIITETTITTTTAKNTKNNGARHFHLLFLCVCVCSFSKLFICIAIVFHAILILPLSG